MSATGAGYDYAVTTYSPDGRVFQVEYAAKAVEKAGTVIGIRCKDGVVLGVEKVIPNKMLVRSSNRRIYNVDLHAGMAITGLAADARQIVNRARSEAAQYRSFYGSEIPSDVLANRVAGYVHVHTLYWYARPFGASVLLSVYDTDGPALYMIEPSGIFYKFFATAIGKHMRSAKTELEKIDFKKVTCREAVKEIARIIYKFHDDIKEKDFELELSWVCDETNKTHQYVPADLHKEAVTIAQELKRKEDMDDSDDDEKDAAAPAGAAKPPAAAPAPSSAAAPRAP